MKGFILCAGIGERLRPLTYTTPKPLIEVGNITLLERIITKFKKNSINEIAINLHHLSDKIKDFLNSNDFGVNFHLYYEKDLLDTGGALKNIKDFIDDFLLVHNGDILTEFDITEAYRYHLKNENDATLCIMERESPRKLCFDDNMNLVGWFNSDKNAGKGDFLNKRKYSFIGVYLISPAITAYFPAENRFGLFDFLIKNLKNIKIKGFLVKPDYWFDIGNIEKLNKARESFSEGQ